MTTQRRVFLAGALAALAGFGLSACHHRRAGPAHGHRLKHERWGVDLVYDSDLGVYRVDGHPFYFFQERFYRQQAGVWEVGDSLQGPWFPIADDLLPYGLRPPGGYRPYRDPYRGLDRDDRFERDDRDDRDKRGKKGKRSRDRDGRRGKDRDRDHRGRDRDRGGRRGRDRDRDHRGRDRDRDKDDERGRD